MDVELGVGSDPGARPDEQRRRGWMPCSPSKTRDGESGRSRTETTTGAGTTSRPGRAHQPEHARILLSTTVTQVLRPTMVNEIGFGYTPTVGIHGGTRRLRLQRLYSLYASNGGSRSAAVRTVRGPSGSSGLVRIGGPQVEEWPYVPLFSTSGGNRGPRGLRRHGDSRRTEPILPPELQRAGSISNDDLSITQGASQHQDGHVRSNTIARRSRVRPIAWETSTSGTTPTTRSAPATATPTCCLACSRTYTELTAASTKPCATGRTISRPGQLARHHRFTVDLGVRVQHSGSDFEVNEMTTAGSSPISGRPAMPHVYTGSSARPACR